MKEPAFLFESDPTGYAIPVFGPISPELSSVVIGGLLRMNDADPEREIRLYVCSPGGEISSGLAIIDVCRLLSNPVATVGIGLVASMGAVLLACAADRGRRFITPNTEAMIHQPFGSIAGNADSVAVATKRMMAVRRRLNSLLAEATGQPPARIAALTRRDRWLTAQEAVQLGLADQVLAAASAVR